MKFLKKTFIFVIVLLSFSAQSSYAANKFKDVTLNNFKFAPRRITISKNTIVRWTHQQSDGVVHDVDSDDKKSFSSSDLRIGNVYQHRFTKKGKFPYHCSFHGDVGGQGMSGVVTVN